MIVNEYGVIFRFSTGFDMSAWTGLSLKFTKPDGSTLTKTNPSVTLGVVNVPTTAGTFLANKYVNYTFVNGDVDQAGTWCAQLTYDDANQHLISDVGHFTVSNPVC